MPVALSLGSETTDEELIALADDLEGAPAEDILRWALDEFGSDVALATGFGAEGCVLIHMLSRIDRNARIFYLDTDLLFPETYQLRDQLGARFNVKLERKKTGLSLT